MVFLGLALLLAALPSHPQASNGPPPALDDFVRRDLQVSHYRWGQADLDGDRRAEQFVLIEDSDFCGSGGCVLVVLRDRGGRYDKVLRSTVTRAPIRVLPTRSQGWRDIAVNVGGGGLEPGTVRLRFNGKRYPGNPTLAPRIPAPRSAVVVIPE
ncbi:hypothetical protein [Caulobacter sp. X]|uniref:hypothetical protein n=1 Tax=Caulobacter sp. X TaxID=2048901 RepID=UPI000C145C1E|nr:hypothetical protein [Caulobacter sp. X]PIB95710.1 hypothetical protein CSW60_14060 [Caulobacter sp. X]